MLREYYPLESEKDARACPSASSVGESIKHLYRFEMRTPMKKRVDGNWQPYYAIGCCYGHN